jgi:hypothetical protein
VGVPYSGGFTPGFEIMPFQGFMYFPDIQILTALAQVFRRITCVFAFQPVIDRNKS